MKQGRKKTGNFSDGSKYPDKLNGGLDWDQIRKDRAARLDAELEKEGVKLGVEHDVHVQELSQAEAEKQALERLRLTSSTPREGPRKQKVYVKKREPVDVDELVRLYVEENLPPRLIAPQVGLAYETVIKYLKTREGVWDQGKYRNRPKEGGVRRGPRTSCPRNHDLTNPDNLKPKFRRLEDGTQVPSGTECIPCRDEKAIQRWRDSRIKEWRDGDYDKLYTCRQYLTYLLLMGGMSGAEAKAKCFELNRIFTGINILEKRTKLAWETSNHHEFIDKERGFNG